MSNVDDGNLQAYIDESLEHLSGIENDLLAIEEAGEDIDEELVNKVFRAAHSIKGGALNLTAGELAAEAANLETIGRQGQLEDCPVALERLAQAFGRLEEYTRAQLAGVSESG